MTAAAAAPAAGCGLFDGSPPAPEPDALTTLWQQLLAAVSGYGRAVAGFPALADRLGPLRDQHQRHVDALAAIMSPAPSPGGAEPGPTGSAVGDSGVGGSGADPAAADSAAGAMEILRTIEADLRSAAFRACVDAPAWRAVLLGEVAAGTATHLEALQ